MKKFYASLVSIFLLSFIGYSQFQKGQKVLGGNVGFSTGKIDYTVPNQSRQTSFSINPSIGWFCKPNVLAGFGVSYGFNNLKNSGTNSQRNESKSQNMAVNAFSQKFLGVANKLFFTINSGASINYSFGKNESFNGSSDISSKSNIYGVNVNLAPGLSYRIGNHFLFDAYLSNLVNIGYTHSQTKGSNSSEKSVSNNFNLSSSLSNTSLGNIGLGFRWLIPNKG
ncbi:MAG: hypothetical protein LH478_03280 [Chitinophagaceae bacterium]|nr:hypothetical protein [Chitinophagaceae bacterium]